MFGGVAVAAHQDPGDSDSDSYRSGSEVAKRHLFGYVCFIYIFLVQTQNPTLRLLPQQLSGPDLTVLGNICSISLGEYRDYHSDALALPQAPVIEKLEGKKKRRKLV